MKIKFVEIQNFRKLKSCRIDLGEQETLFVGANNSGKTSAMDSFIQFLVKGRQNNFSTTDFTLSNWNEFNRLALSWLSESEVEGAIVSDWQPLCPTLDVWLNVEDNEIHYISDLIPTLSWKGGDLGVRLIFQPTNMELLKGEFLISFKTAQELKSKATKIDSDTSNLYLWPETMQDFLEKKLYPHFSICAYILDPKKIKLPKDGVAIPQKLNENSQPLEVKPFDGLFKIDLIEAQRFFADPNASNSDSSNKSTRNLSSQIQKYYTDHLNPSELPDSGDLEALQAIELARNSFDLKLNESFENAIKELEVLGYPGFSDPTIKLTSKLNPIDTLDHEAAIQYNIQKGTGLKDEFVLTLPEKYNGLGYKNLIWMVFKLIAFRDGWMRLGKAGKRKSKDGEAIQPLHLVLIEEPEAHLHTQVQQVFIRKAYSVLRNHENLGNKKQLTTQLIVSTHSSYLAREVNFSNLRYFRRKIAETATNVPCATVVNLANTFGEKIDETSKFVARYLKTTHCDLFFANGVIIVEGAAERILIPHFIRTHYPKLSSSYISILEIGGSHAHRIRPLIENLGLTTLVITDIDAVDETGNKTKPELNDDYSTSNTTIKNWLPGESKLNILLNANNDSKIKGNVRVAYQYGIEVEFESTKSKIFPYTFEDSLAFTNISLFKELSSSTGLVKKLQVSLMNNDLSAAHDEIFKDLQGSDKAKMALDLLFEIEPKDLKPPLYISEGLEWLADELDKVALDFIVKPSESEG